MAEEIIYNKYKLVRDNILEIIKNHNKRYSYHIAQEEEYRLSLIDKMQEELAEFSQTPNEEEAADILEVLYALFDLHNLDRIGVEQIRQKKLTERGGFEKRIILEKVWD